MKKLNILIYGATGYIGSQLVKLLVNHRYVRIKYLCGNNSVGKRITSFDKSIKKQLPKIIKFKKDLLNEIDVVFTSLPNGKAQKLSKYLKKNNLLIDLSADFRLQKTKDYLKWYKKKHSAKKLINKSIYALPEIKKKKLKNYQIVSCPGCYPTSILLPLIPLIKKNLINNKNITIDSKSGYSGAGKNVHKKYKNKNLYESLSAYGVFGHRHIPEIQQELNKFSKSKTKFTFTPHLSPMFRGILTNIYVDLKKNKSINNISLCLKKFYKDSTFVNIQKNNTYLSTNSVINTNTCKISVCRTNDNNKVVILSAIDNLIKGGAGQAVQNLNLIYNYPIKEGLK